jgi:hypothetical protein
MATNRGNSCRARFSIFALGPVLFF